MKAIVALMVVAATSASLVPTNFNGMDKTNFIDYLRQQRTGGDLVDNVFPFGQISTQYPTTYTTYFTLAQLYSHPLFAKYTTLPLFQYHLTFPAFQRFLESQYFQKYWTVQDFQQFFSSPALFYKYVYPVVAIKFQTYGTFDKVIVVPEVYREYVPDYVNYFVQQQQTLNYNTINFQGQDDLNKFGGKNFQNNLWSQIFNKKPVYNGENNMYTNMYTNMMNNKNYLNTIVNKPITNFEKMFNKDFDFETIYNKNIDNVVFNKNYDYVNTMLNKPVNFEKIFNKDYNMETGFNKNINFETILNKPVNFEKVYNKDFNMKTVLNKYFNKNYDFGTIKPTNTEFFATLFNAYKNKQMEGTFNYPTVFDGQTMYTNDFNKVLDIFSKFYAMDKTVFETIKNDVVLRNLFKDAFGVTFDDVQQVKGYKVPVVQDTIQNVVDPITGDIKIVEEKLVKPVNTDDVITNIQGDLVKDAILRKVILKKELYNKV